MSFFLTLKELFDISRGAPYTFTKDQLEKVNLSHLKLREYLESPNRSLLYGIDTGFGPHAFQNNSDRDENQLALVYHLTVANPEEAISHAEARAVIAARIHSLSLGGSGIAPETLLILAHCLKVDCIPWIPEKGSLSASGDLIPLSYIALALLGESNWTGSGKSLGPTLKNQKLSSIPGLPKKLAPKEALSLTNGTSFTTGLLALQIFDVKRLLEALFMNLESLFCFHKIYSDAFLPALHETKRHNGPVFVAKRLHPVIFKNSKIKKEGHRIQDIYSIRCIPQILGSILDEIESIEKVVEDELNSLSDNPIFIEDEDRFVEGGNFYASHVSFGADRLQNSMAVFATWLERFIQYLFSPTENNDFPLSLSPSPGKYAGLSGLGLLATHITADIRRDSMPGTVQSLTSNGNNQDIVPMGAISILRNRRTVTGLYTLTSILTYTVFQAAYLKNYNLENSELYRDLEPLKKDRRLDQEIDLIRSRLNEL